MDERVKNASGEKSAAKKIICIAVLIVVVLAAAIGIGVYRSGANQLQGHLDLGQKYLDELNYEQALVEFEAAIEIDPKCVDAYLGMAVTYESMGNDPAVAMTSEEGYEKSLETYDRLLEQVGEDERVLTSLSDSLRKYIDILLADKRYDEIRELAEKYGDYAAEIDFGVILGELEESEIGTMEPAESAPVEQVQVSIQETDIEADSVFNTDGYGSLLIRGVGSLLESPLGDGVIPPQAALIDSNGNFVFPYRPTDLRYYVSDGIVSLSENSAYRISDNYNMVEYPPEYYNIDGSSVFSTEPVFNQIDEDTAEAIYWLGGPMHDGYALVTQLVSTDYVGIEFYSLCAESHLCIVDRNGAITTLPEEFNENYEQTDIYIDSVYELGWCGEGLYAICERGYDEDWDYTFEAIGYMDPAGNMVLDLTGSGFTSLWPFHEGLAAVRSESGLIGFIDKTGALVIPCVYEGAIEDFSEDGICAVEKDGKWGYIDKDNNVVIPFEYDGAYGAGDGLASVVKDGKCGLVDYGNNMIVPLEYDDISSCEEGVVYAVKEGVLYIISKSNPPG